METVEKAAMEEAKESEEQMEAVEEGLRKVVTDAKEVAMEAVLDAMKTRAGMQEEAMEVDRKMVKGMEELVMEAEEEKALVTEVEEDEMMVMQAKEKEEAVMEAEAEEKALMEAVMEAEK